MRETLGVAVLAARMSGYDEIATRPKASRDARTWFTGLIGLHLL
jgi:hypothetical protein